MTENVLSVEGNSDRGGREMYSQQKKIAVLNDGKCTVGRRK